MNKRKFLQFEQTAFQRKLINWYHGQKRDLPWRQTSDPYAIWVSEVMLQQTQVSTVIPYYSRWLQKFPTVVALAQAEEQQVLKLWEGLGYYARARNFHRAAGIVDKEFSGIIPDDYSAFRNLPGVGDYTAAAVLSIAFGRKLAVVDGNVKRVIARLLMLEEAVNDIKNYDQFAGYAGQLLATNSPSAHNQAMMELGALICRPRQPVCGDCPVSQNCRAFASHCQTKYPIRKARKKIPLFKHVAVVVERGSKLLIARRPENGLLGGLWEFPDIRVNPDEQVRQAADRLIADDLNLSTKSIQPLADVTHVFTHFKMDLSVFHITESVGRPSPRRHTACRWVTREQLTEYPFPGVQHKFLPAVLATLPSKRR